MIWALVAILLAGAIGACLGSYAVTAALRLTAAEQSLLGRSHCDTCGIELGYAATVPIVSFVRLRGCCSSCGGRIDVTHLIGELAGLMIVLSALSAAPPQRAILLAALGLTLLASAVIDARSQRLPDRLTLVIGAIGAVLAAQRSMGSLAAGCAAAVIAFVTLELVRRGYQSLRREPGLGFGDVKLIAALGLWLGVATPWALVLASVAGFVGLVLFERARARIAFGPYIAVAAWTVGLFSEARGWPI
jgi:leader peptidase (prepilin peptidase) / N-methyltransferase